MALAMLALFAQLWMVQLSTVHWGQMLSEQALFIDPAGIIHEAA